MLRKKRAPPSSSAASHHLPSSAAETVLNIDDLLTQILICLPPRSILRFKSVSKRWLALITSPDFIIPIPQHTKSISGLCFRHLNQRGQEPSYGFINLSKTSPSSPPPFKTLDFADNIIILNSCNGLILCSNDTFSDTETFHVYNPTTNRSTTLPDLTPEPEPPMIYAASLAFDPSKSPHYKVICVIIDPDPVNQFVKGHYRLMIYSSETRAWKPCGDPFLPNRDVNFGAGVFWNQSIHWLSFSGYSSLRFDVEQEQLRNLPMPPKAEDEYNYVCELIDNDNDSLPWAQSRYRWFGQSGGDHLNLVEIDEPEPLRFKVSPFRVFEMEPDYSGWFVRYNVDLGPMVKAFPEMVLDHGISRIFLEKYDDDDDRYYGGFTMLGMVQEEDDDDFYLVLLLPRSHMAVQYNLKDGSFRKICDLDADKCSLTLSFHIWSKVVTHYVYPFIESLASV